MLHFCYSVLSGWEACMFLCQTNHLDFCPKGSTLISSDMVWCTLGNHPFFLSLSLHLFVPFFLPHHSFSCFLLGRTKHHNKAPRADVMNSDNLTWLACCVFCTWRDRKMFWSLSQSQRGLPSLIDSKHSAPFKHCNIPLLYVRCRVKCPLNVIVSHWVEVAWLCCSHSVTPPHFCSHTSVPALRHGQSFDSMQVNSEICLCFCGSHP